MADTERRLFTLSWIFQLGLFISCFYLAQSSGDDVEYSLSNQLDLFDKELVLRRLPSNKREFRYARAAVDDVSTQVQNSTTAPDSVTSGTVNQTHQPPNPSGPDSSSSQNTTTSIAADPETTTAPITTTTPKDPFADADIIHDHHEYYTSQSLKEQVSNFYVELATASRHSTLSENHRVAASIKLKFKFPFYGHLVDHITIATGGFVYMSPFLHQWLTATQYIAPLMANFDPSISSNSHIYYLSEEEMFTVEWKEVKLKDQQDYGNFTFQLSLHKNGSIIFVYKNVPVHINQISDKNHPVKVGLSDAYYNDTYLPRFRVYRRTIYEYHQVAVDEALARTGAVVFMNPVRTCNILTDCDSCVRHENVSFDCKWCNTIGRCSDGLDWFRQHWDKNECPAKSLSNASECVNLKPPSKPIVNPIIPHGPQKHKDECTGGNCGKGSDTPVAVVVVVVILILVLVGGVGGWTYYAYTRPTSKSGMWLMEHRPSQIKAKIKFWKDNSSSSNGAKYKTETEA